MEPDPTTRRDLEPLPDLLGALLGDEHPDVQLLVREEHRRWHDLHDRLIAIISALIDEAVDSGLDLQQLLDGVTARTTVGVEDLIGDLPDPADIAGLLRSHHSTGTVEVGSTAAEFVHECGSGLAHWRRQPDVSLVVEGEVQGVPAGVPRYCARCIHTIRSVGGERWTVRPPSDPSQPCTWLLDVEEPSSGEGA